MNTKNHLYTSETFYSIQGEGPCAGQPAVFLRLSGCNLQCSGFSYKDPTTGEHLGCDSKLVWSKGHKFTFADIIGNWQQHGWLDKLACGAHLVITGGEPLLQQTKIVEFIKQLDECISPAPFIEIETNATKLPIPELQIRVNQFNVSPKLRSSGEPDPKAYHPDILQSFAALPSAAFKFVIQSPGDIEEIIARYCQPFNIPRNKVWLMPEGGTREAILAKSTWLIEACKQHLMNYTSRLQVDIWNEVTGV